VLPPAVSHALLLVAATVLLAHAIHIALAKRDSPGLRFKA